jgi:K+-sensing histidine kinase KdpD
MSQGIDDVPPSESAETTPARSPREDPRSTERAGYLAFVAHEMRNPLATALWSAELLVRLSPEERGGPRGEKLAGMCLRTLSRLRHLVEDHFLAERLSIGGIPVRVEPVSLREAIAAALGRAAPARSDVSTDDFVVMADRAMFERAIEALVASASREDAPVSVRSALLDSPRAVAVEVRGAPPAPDALRIPDRSTPSDPTGRALGLLMARAVAYAHGGSLAPLADGFALVVPADDAPAGDAR